MTEQVAEEVTSPMASVVGRIRDAAADVDLDRLRDTASSAVESASAALSSVDLDAGRKAMKKRTKKARKAAAKKMPTGKSSLRERVFGWPLYSVAAAGAVLGSLAWRRGRQSQAGAMPPAPSEISVVDPADIGAAEQRSTG